MEIEDRKEARMKIIRSLNTVSGDIIEYLHENKDHPSFVDIIYMTYGSMIDHMTTKMMEMDGLLEEG